MSLNNQYFVFYSREIMRQLKVPSRYRVFCVVSLGYPKEKSGRNQQSQRFDMKDVYFNNNFGNQFDM